MPDINLSLKVPAIEKLIDYGASGVGAIAGPMLAPWRASREAQARLASARVDVEVHRIEAESEAGTSAIIAKARSEARGYLVTPDAEVRGTLEITREDITQRIEFQERKRIANVRSVLEDAADELGDKEVTDHEPDPGLDCPLHRQCSGRFLRGPTEDFGRKSSPVKSKVLGELHSVRWKLSRNMTKRDAAMFRDICDFVISNDFVFYNDSVKSIGALQYGELLHVQDCGLINLGPDLVMEVRWGDNNKEHVFTHQIGALMVKRNPSAKEVLKIPEIVLTTAGKELSRFVQCTFHMEYLQALSKFLKSENCELSYLEGVVPLADGRFGYARRIPIEPQPEQVDGVAP